MIYEALKVTQIKILTNQKKKKFKAAYAMI